MVMNMSIKFHCPKCDQHLVVDDSGAGAEVTCPNCKNEISIPEGLPHQDKAEAVAKITPPRKAGINIKSMLSLFLWLSLILIIFVCPGWIGEQVGRLVGWFWGYIFNEDNLWAPLAILAVLLGLSFLLYKGLHRWGCPKTGAVLAIIIASVIAACFLMPLSQRGNLRVLTIAPDLEIKTNGRLDDQTLYITGSVHNNSRWPAKNIEIRTYCYKNKNEKNLAFKTCYVGANRPLIPGNEEDFSLTLQLPEKMEHIEFETSCISINNYDIEYSRQCFTNSLMGALVEGARQLREGRGQK